jgi:tetratricopeptide (TPR) repeat protein
VRLERARAVRRVDTDGRQGVLAQFLPEPPPGYIADVEVLGRGPTFRLCKRPRPWNLFSIMPGFRVFLSAVSSEFAAPRSALASDLRARGLEVKVQEDFRQEAQVETTLAKLHQYIAECDAVVAIMGTRSGSLPPPAAAEPFRHMLPAGIAEASYTQWEILFARHHNRRLSIYVADAAWQPDRTDPAGMDRPELQAALRNHLFKERGLDRVQGFASEDQLCRQVLREDWPDRRTAKPVHPRFRTIGSLFKGRAGVMEQLRESLTRSGRTAIPGKPHALHGLGGIGKTRLAVEYGLAHAGEYNALLFVSGETPELLDTNVAALAGVLGLPQAQATEDEARIRAALDWLKLNPGWFLVLDNLDTPEALRAAEGLLAQLSGGHTVVTSRLSTFSGLFEPLELDVLDPEAAAEFLLERTDRGRRRLPDDIAIARAIAQDLGWLALALEQAGAYIVQRRRTLAQYRADWAANRDAVLAWFDPSVTDYPASVAITWQTSVLHLTSQGLLLLHRLAFMAAEPVPEFLLDVPIPGAEIENLHAALADLARYSLLSRAAAAPVFSVHRLVQDVTARSLDEAGRQATIGELVGWVDAGFEGDPDDVLNWPRLGPLAAHAAAAIQAAVSSNAVGRVSLLSTKLARLLYARALYVEAEPHFRRALALDEASLGREHPRVAVMLNNLAQLLQTTNRLVEAEPLMRRALAISETSVGPDHPRVARLLDNLARLLQETNRLDEAEPLMRRALAIHEASFGPEHPRVAHTLSVFAQLLHAANRLGEAEPLMRRARAIGEASFEPGHPEIALRLNDLAALLCASNRLGEAEPMMRRALAINNASFGPEHPNVAITLSNLAQLLQTTNRLGEAEQLMRRALAIDETAFGPQHPRVAVLVNNLAQLLHMANRLDQAEPLMRRAIEIFVVVTRDTGHEQPHLAVSCRNFAALLRATGRNQDYIQASIAELLAPIQDILAARDGA